MLQFYEKRSWRGVLKSWWVVGILAFVCLFLLWVVYDRYTIERDMAKRRAEAEAHVAELKARKEHIKDKVEYLSSERGMEAEMRRNFDVAQPGEQVVIIVDEEKKDSEVTPLQPIADTPPWYIFWR
ncbi:MAG: FtsB family cell division protein [Candidatus Paceibacteria bacterium]